MIVKMIKWWLVSRQIMLATCNIHFFDSNSTTPRTINLLQPEFSRWVTDLQLSLYLSLIIHVLLPVCVSTKCYESDWCLTLRKFCETAMTNRRSFLSYNFGISFKFYLRKHLTKSLWNGPEVGLSACLIFCIKKSFKMIKMTLVYGKCYWEIYKV